MSLYLQLVGLLQQPPRVKPHIAWDAAVPLEDNKVISTFAFIFRLGVYSANHSTAIPHSHQKIGFSTCEKVSISRGFQKGARS